MSDPMSESTIGAHGRMITVEIMGRPYAVPEGLTMLRAMWYTGHEVIRGAGCLGGFCGACAATYRTKDDVRLRNALACQMLVEDGMSFYLNFSYYPNRKAVYNLDAIADTKQELFKIYPEASLCRNCNACTEACPQGIDVRDGVWKAVFGDFEKVSEMFMDCVMCGQCIPVCIADIAPNHVALYASRALGARLTSPPQNLTQRVAEIQSGKYAAEWTRILSMNEEELKTAAQPSK
ncbi:MAG TPA: 4Fe-4S dicluster domain-containing protein [Nitrospiria bacterium]